MEIHRPTPHRSALLLPRWQGGLLLTAMAGLSAVPGWMLAGAEGVVWAVGTAWFLFLLTPHLPTAWVMRLHRAVPLRYHQAPALFHHLDDIARRAGLRHRPELYYIPSPGLNALAVGVDGDGAIALTEGLLQRLGEREWRGVLAHETCHIRNGDTRLMLLAEMFRRVTTLGSLLCQGLVWMGLILLPLAGRVVEVYWPALMVLILSPTLSVLLQLALSRSREFRADRDAVELTGDPAGLASALARLHPEPMGFWQRMWRPRRETPVWLRTHPSTEERIQRLLALDSNVLPAYSMALPQVRIHSPWRPAGVRFPVYSRW